METKNKLSVLRKELQEACELHLQKENNHEKELTEKLITILNPQHPIAVRVKTDSIEFFTTTESDKGKSDHGSTVTVTNTGISFIYGVEKVFEPKLSYSSMHIVFSDNKFGTYQITKFQILH